MANGTLKVSNIETSSGSGTITIGASGETVDLSNGTITGITQGITEADVFRLTADISATNGDITSNLERADNSSFSKIGTGMSESSGIFTFPSTGLYQIIVSGTFLINSSDLIAELLANVTINNSSYDDIFQVQSGYEGSNSKYETNTNSGFVNVTDTSNVKIKFTTGSFAGSTLLKGDTNYNRTSFTFIRLGDSQ